MNGKVVLKDYSELINHLDKVIEFEGTLKKEKRSGKTSKKIRSKGEVNIVEDTDCPNDHNTEGQENPFKDKVVR